MSSLTSCKTVNVRRPKKSNLRRPILSTSLLANCTATVSSFTASGAISVMSFPDMIIPAACVPALRGRPSTRIAISITLRDSGSVSYASLNSVLISSACFNVMPTENGIIFVSLLLCDIGMLRTLATSLTACLAASVPNVITWATLVLPYFAVT